MAQYDSAIALAKRLIDKFGRDAFIRRTTDGAPLDPAKPWEPGAPTTANHAVRAVFLNRKRETVEGSTVVKDVCDCLVAASGLAIAPGTKDHVLEDALVWEIVDAQPLKPAGDAVMYEMKLRR